MLNKFEETKRKQRFGLRKLKVGVASVLLGFTIFGFNLASQELPSVHADVVAENAGSGSDSSSSVTNDSSEVPEASAASVNGTNESGSQPAASAASDSTNTLRGVTGTTEKASSGTAGADATGDSETTAATNATATETKTDTSDLKPTEVPAADVTMSDDPMKADMDQNAGKNSWVSRNLKWNYDIVDPVIKKIINKRPDLYFFEGLVDYNESKHIIVLLGLDKNSALAGYSQNDVYGFIVHTGEIKESGIRSNIESFVVTPGDTYQSTYDNTDHPVQVRNYGTNVEVNLMAGKGSDKVLDSDPGHTYGLVPVFDDGLNKDHAGSLDLTDQDGIHRWIDNNGLGSGQYDYYAKQMSITSWQTPIPRLTTMTIRYLDQATGQELATPQSFTGFAYQGFTIQNLTAPKIDGYTLVGQPTVDGKIEGQISQYKVGETYPLYYSDNVVVQQTVLNEAGDVLARAYFNGLPIPGCSKILKHNSADTMTIIYDGQLHVYQNKIGTVQQSLIYRYQKLDQANKSTLTVHYIDVTDAQLRSGFLPTDGKEVATQSYTGKIGDAYTATLPAGYQGYAIMQGDLTGTFSATVHDAYVYLSNQDADKYTPVVQSITVGSGTVADEALAKSAIANAAQLPEGTKYVWTKAPNTATLGDQEGELQIQYPDHTTDTVNVPVTVKGNAFPTLPDLLLVDNATNLSDAEKTTLLQRLKEANKGLNNYWKIPGDISAVAADGTVTVTYDGWGSSNDYSVTIPGSLLVREKKFADVYEPTTPTTKVPVKNTQNLQADEKAKVKQAIIDANQANPAWTNDKVKDVVIADDGTATIIYVDSSTDTIIGTDLVTSFQNGHHMVIMPEKILVVDRNELSGDEKKAVLAAMIQKNRVSEKTHVKQVGFVEQDTKVRVTYADDSYNDVEVSQLVKEAMLFPTPPTPVQNLTALTPEEKATLKKAIEDKNANYFPTDYLSDTSLVTVVVNNDGSATITYNTMGADGQTLTPTQSLTIPAGRLVKLADNVAYKAQTPTQKTPVVNKAQLNDTEKEKVEAAILDYNHKQDNTFLTKDMIEIADDGTATITYPDQTTMTINGTDLVSQYVVTAVEGKSIPRGTTVEPQTMVTIKDDAGKTYTLPAENFEWSQALDTSKIKPDVKGEVTVTLPGGPIKVPVTVNVIASQADEAKLPAEPVGYDLDEMIASVKDAIKANLQQANPTATINVADDGTATLSFSDHSTKQYAASELAKGYRVSVVNTSIIKGNSKEAHSLIKVTDEAGQVVSDLDDQETWVEEPDWQNVTGDTLSGKVQVILPGVNRLKVTKDVTIKLVANTAEKVQGVKVGYFAGDDVNGEDIKQAVTTALVAANTDGDGVPLFNADQVTIENGQVVITFRGETEKKTFALAELLTAYTVTAKTGVEVPSVRHIVGTLDAKDTVTITGGDLTDVQVAWTTGPDVSTIDGDVKGAVTVTLPGGLTKQIPVSYNVVANDADGYQAIDLVPVNEMTALNSDEKDLVIKRLLAKNPDTLTKDGIKISSTGNAFLTFKDGSTLPVDTEKLVKSADNNYKVQGLDTKIAVSNPGQLTGKEQQKVEDAILAKNPDLPGGQSGTTISFTKDEQGRSVVHFVYPDKTTSDYPVTDFVIQYQVTPKNDQKLPRGTKPSGKDLVTISGENGEITDWPADSFKVDIDTSTLGPTTAKVTVTMPDGKTKVPVSVQLEIVENEADKLVAPSADKKVAYFKDDKDTERLTKVKNQIENNLREANPSLPADTKFNYDLHDPANPVLVVVLPDNGGSREFALADLATAYTVTAKTGAEVPSVRHEVGTLDARDTVTITGGDLTDVQVAWTTGPDVSTIDGDVKGAVTVTLPSGVAQTFEVHYQVVANQADQTDIKTPSNDQKVVVEDPKKLDPTEQDKVEDAVKDVNKDSKTGQSTLPNGTTVETGKDGTTTITYPDGSKKTLDADKTTRKAQDKDHYQVTEVDVPRGVAIEKGDEVKAGNLTVIDKDGKPTTLPTETKVVWVTVPDVETVGDGKSGQVKVTYPDGSDETVDVKVNVKPSQADQTDIKTPSADQKVVVEDPTKLDPTEQDKVEDAVKDANKDSKTGQSTLPNGTTVETGKDGTTTITYPDGSKKTLDADKTTRKAQDKDHYQVTEVDVPRGVAIEKGDEVKAGNLTVIDKDGKPTTLPTGTKVVWVTVPDVETVGDGKSGQVKVTYPDGSDETVDVKVNVKPSQADQTDIKTPSADQKVVVEDPTKLDPTEQDKVEDAVKDANKDSKTGQSTLPNGTTVETGKDGTTTITYPDGSKKTLDADKTTRKAQDKDHYQVTEVDVPRGVAIEKGDEVKAGNLMVIDKDGKPTTLPTGTKVVWVTVPDVETVGDGKSGQVKVTYPDGSDETVDVKVNVKPSQADQTDIKTPSADQKVVVEDPTKLDPTEQDKVEDAVKDANKDSKTGQSTLPNGTTVETGKDGTTTITYPDGSKKTLDADKTTRKAQDKDHYQVTEVDVPRGVAIEKGDEVKAGNLTVIDKDGKPTTLPTGTKVVWVTVPDVETVGDGKSGQVKVTYPDGSDETVDVKVNVKPSQADQTDIKTPSADQKVVVEDPTKLDPTEQDKVEDAVKDANKDSKTGQSILPNGTTVETGKDGTTTITYPDGSKKTLDADKTTRKAQDKDHYQVTEVDVPRGVAIEKGDEVKAGNLTVIDKDGKPTTLPTGTKVVWVTVPDVETVGDGKSGQVKVTYPDGSDETVDVKVNVKPSQADQTDIKTPSADQKVVVEDPTKLDPTEQDKVEDAVKDANKDSKTGQSTLPNGTTVETGKDGTTTITYPDGSKKTLDADKTTRKAQDKDHYQVTEVDVPRGVAIEKGDEVKAGNLTVIDKDGKPTTLPTGTKVVWVTVPDVETVGDGKSGQVKVTYPDGSDETVDVKVNVKPSQADQTDIKTPSADQKVVVEDPTKLDPTEQDKVEDAVKDANKDSKTGQSTLPNGTTVETGKDGTTTITYPDGSKKTLDADKTTRKAQDKDHYQVTEVDVPRGVAIEKGDEVKAGNLTVIDKDGKPTTLPTGTKVVWVTVPDVETVGDGKSGQVKVTYPDGSDETVDVKVNVKPSQADQTDIKTPSADQKVVVEDPTKLDPTEQDKVEDAVKDANKDSKTGQSTLPNGTTVETGKDGTTTITYPDGSKKTLDADKTTRKAQDKDHYQVTEVDVPRGVAIEKGDEVKAGNLTVIDKDGKPTTLPTETKVVWVTVPDVETVGDGKSGQVKVTYPDGSDETVDVKVNVKPSQADQTDIKTPSADQKVVVEDPTKLDPTEQDKVEDAVKDANKDSKTGQSILPNGTTVETGKDGTTTITYPDGSKKTLDADKTTRKAQDKDHYQVTEVDVPRGVAIEKGDEVKAGNLTVIDKDGKPTTLPTGTKVVWVTVPDVETVGDGKSGQVKVTYPDGSDETVDVKVNVKPSQADQTDIKTPSADQKVVVEDPTKLDPTEQDKVEDAVKDVNKDSKTGQSTLPNGTTVETGKDGTTTITYPDGSKKTLDADKTTRKAQDKDHYQVTEVDVPRGVAIKRGDEVKPGNLTVIDKDGKPTTLPTETKVVWVTVPDVETVGDGKSGQVKVTYPDGSDETVDVKVNVKPSQADQTDIKTPSADQKVVVEDPTKLDPTEQDKVEDAVKDANKDSKTGQSTLPNGTTVETGKDGTTTITYPDGSKKTLDADKTTRKAQDKDHYQVTEVDVPRGVAIEKGDEVKAGNLTVIDKDGKPTTLPTGTKVVWVTVPDVETVGDGKSGQVKVTYPDDSDETVDVKVNVKPSQADQTDIKKPSNDQKVVVEDPTKLDPTEEAAVEKAVKDANTDPDTKESALPDGTTVETGEDGTTTITYPDGSKDTIEGKDLVTKKVLAKLEIDAPDKRYDGKTTTITVKLIDEKTGEELILTPSEGDLAFYQIPGDGKLPDNVFKTLMALAADPAPTPDPALIWIPLSELPVKPGHYIILISEQGKKGLEKKYGDKYQIENLNVEDEFYIVSLDDTSDPKVPGDKVKVDDPTKLTDDEKDQVKNNIADANKDQDGKSALPDGTKVDVDDQGNATITYPDKSTETIPAEDLVKGKTDAEKNNPKVPGKPIKVDDDQHLSDGEKDQVKDNVEKANPGTTVDVDDKGNATITYSDGSKDQIPGKDLVDQKTDAEKTDPKVPDDKVKVDDDQHLTDGEKDQVKDNVEKSNPGTTVTVDDQGNTTIQYPDGSKNEIPGNQLIDEKSDAEKTTPNVPAQPVKVDDPTNLTAGEKAQVKDNVGKANPETTVTVENDGTATITYPDGSKATISGDQLVKGKTDAEKATPNLPTTKTPVQDPSHLTPAEQAAVQANVAKANVGVVVTVDTQGNATLTYPDGSQLTLAADQLVKAAITSTAAPTPSATTPAPTATTAATPVKAATLPQTGDADAAALALSGLTLALIGLIGAKKKRSEEN
ncbi:Rib/alpha-like domain-containing protein [Limosilactobacillus ingluviei]